VAEWYPAQPLCHFHPSSSKASRGFAAFSSTVTRVSRVESINRE